MLCGAPGYVIISFGFIKFYINFYTNVFLL